MGCEGGGVLGLVGVRHKDICLGGWDNCLFLSFFNFVILYKKWNWGGQLPPYISGSVTRVTLSNLMLHITPSLLKSINCDYCHCYLQ